MKVSYNHDLPFSLMDYIYHDLPFSLMDYRYHDLPFSPMDYIYGCPPFHWDAPFQTLVHIIATTHYKIINP